MEMEQWKSVAPTVPGVLYAMIPGAHLMLK